MTREDPDGVEHVILGFFLLASSLSFLFYPMIALFISNEDIAVYNHLFYFCRTLLPSPTALVVGWAVTGVIVNLVTGVTAIFIFVVATPILMYVVTQTFRTTKLRELW